MTKAQNYKNIVIHIVVLDKKRNKSFLNIFIAHSINKVTTDIVKETIENLLLLKLYNIS